MSGNLVFMVDLAAECSWLEISSFAIRAELTASVEKSGG
jgi:hypothetical protein